MKSTLECDAGFESAVFKGEAWSEKWYTVGVVSEVALVGRALGCPVAGV